MSINKRSDENLLDLKRDEHKKSVIKKEKGKVLQQANSFFVDVKGSVSYPQVVEVKEGDIVQKAINLAGGTNSVADLNQLNLAEKLIPNQVVYVPFKSEKIPEQFLTKAKNIENEDTSDNSSGSKKVIDINESNSSDLQQINGIGSKKADEIIKFRNENGHFKSIDDLKKISGFGDKTVEKLKEYLKVG
ncbi:helix-hairpin-helix domain-containing protein [Oenococcus alcoholitolerans]|uniref:helix-hairpin-helix domain-containing protein n=1 Tax=Oenococcus alcoholitolerans TaxID=931074 RepID=UPI003F72B103